MVKILHYFRPTLQVVPVLTIVPGLGLCQITFPLPDISKKIPLLLSVVIAFRILSPLSSGTSTFSEDFAFADSATIRSAFYLNQELIYFC